MARISGVGDRKDTSRSDQDWSELRTVRLIRTSRKSVTAAKATDEILNLRRKVRLKKLLASVDARVDFLVRAAAVDGGLDRALAELVFGYGAEKLARELGKSPKAFYRSFSFTERRSLPVQTIQDVLAFFGMRLTVEALR